MYSTAAKLSMLNFGLPFMRTLPEVGAALSIGGRFHLLALFAGIVVPAAGQTVSWTPGVTSATWTPSVTSATWTPPAASATWTPEDVNEAN